MKLLFSIPGSLCIGYNEFRRLVKGSIISYIWFALFAAGSCYVLFLEDYSDFNVSRSIMDFEYGEAPMTDILIFYSSSFISSVSDVLPGATGGEFFPASIGAAFFIIFPFFLGLILISKFVTVKATSSIAKEKEGRTLYILTASPQTRLSIFIGKFIGILLLTLPIIVLLYIITRWTFAVLFPPAFNISTPVLKTAGVTVLLFASIGMLVSVLSGNEKRASWRGLRVLITMILLTVLWILLPFIRFILNLTNKNVDFLQVLEKITFISPFTWNLMSVYNPAVSNGYFIIQLGASFVFLILGMVIFIRQDIEY